MLTQTVTLRNCGKSKRKKVLLGPFNRVAQWVARKHLHASPLHGIQKMHLVIAHTPFVVYRSAVFFPLSSQTLLGGKIVSIEQRTESKGAEKTQCQFNLRRLYLGIINVEHGVVRAGTMRFFVVTVTRPEKFNYPKRGFKLRIQGP